MKVIIYTIPTCEFSKKLIDYLKSKKIEFENREPTEESEFYSEMLDKTGEMYFPTIDIDGKMIVGFDKEKLDAALA
jgi:glutaredoxin 3